ncbi:hypothetical protein ACNOYE_20130 [Nannocystaceae bacterium ST9]
MSHRHHLELLVADRGYLVQFCATCEIVHVDVGPVTLRLRPGALDSLAQVLTRASERLHEQQAELGEAEVIDIRDLLSH